MALLPDGWEDSECIRFGSKSVGLNMLEISGVRTNVMQLKQAGQGKTIAPTAQPLLLSK
jgi:hypothetical protein